MSITQVPEFYTTQFGTNWDHLAQQMTARLKNAGVRMDSVNGKERTYNQMSSTVMRLITTRSGPTTPQDLTLAKRWVRPNGYDCVSWLDEFDEKLLGSTVLPTSDIVKAHAMAYNRTCDQVLIDALTGVASTGETGTTNTVLPTAQKVAVDFVLSGAATNSGLTLPKMIEAKSILGQNNVFETQRPGSKSDLIAIVKQEHLDDLLNNVAEISSADYNNVRALVDGTVDYFMGFNFIRSEQLGWVDQANDISEAIFFHRDGAVLTEGEKKVYMDVRDDYNHTLQIRTVGWLGATRLQEEFVVQVACDESP